MKPPSQTRQKASSWQSLEHTVYRMLRSLGLSGQTVLVACSGGRDSMVLAEVLYRLRGGLGIDLRVCSVHHGLTADSAVNEYRARARVHVHRWAEQRHILVFTNEIRMGDGASSEAALRRLRWEFLRNWQHQTQGLVATGHHAQDFLETRLINLIRGSGPHGLRSMSVFDSERRLLRPLLTLSPSEIAAYAQVQKVEFIDDPSNGTLTPLRNWIRHAWLPALETKRRGATATLARSLELLAQAQESTSKGPVMELRREDFRGLDSTKKAVVIVELFRQRGLKTYTKAQVNEFLKRLDTPRKNFTFSVAGLKWMADAERVIALESDDAGVEFDSR